MARRSPINVGLALALIYVISFGQASENCKTGCRGAAHTFKYRDGTTYKYSFDSKIQVSLSSAEGQQSVTEVRATVLLTQQPQCNQILKLQNVQVISNGKKHSNIPDIDKPISINYHDGHLEDSICVTPGDTQNSLNLKRAIASLFQVNIHGGHETDVFGLCPTEVAQHKEGNVLVIQKSRNLNRCAYRESIKQDFLATAFNLHSEIKSSPILNGDYNAKLRIKNGILEQITAQEEYLYVPFSVGNNGAKASVETTLKYVGTTKDNAQVKNGQPRSIIFEDPHPVSSPHTNVNSILAAVKEVAKTIDITVGENTAKEFSNLVRILRVSKKDDLLAVYNQVRAGVGFSDKIAGKKIFLDALLRAGNGDNIEVAIELLKNKELGFTEQNLVYLGLSTVRHATENSLNSAITLLNQPNLPRSAYLGIGNLAGRYCRQHSCSNIEAVSKLTEKLVQKLGNGKASNRQQENDIIYVLKAVTNIHYLDDNILGKITAIAQDRKAPNRLRVTALETYLADPCKDKLRDSALSILKDIQQDSEVRIKAYLVLSQCPNNKVGNAVKSLLETEPSYQVGGFIVTHIRNLRSSANPDKELAKKYLGQIILPKRFPFDLRKYSANGEFSYNIETLGIANSLETNIIYSQNSFLPRSTNLNLTAEVFGHTFNFLEIVTRQENLDRLIEHYLGPRGLLRSKNLQELWNDKGTHATNFVRDLKERIQKTIRARRDVSKAEIDHINKQVLIKTNELNTDLDLDLSIKAFGSELLFFNVNDDIRKYTPDAIIDKIVDGIDQGVNKLKQFEETLRSNLLFLDAEFAYPTSSGFPLRLGIEGSSTIQLKTSGAIDIRALFSEDSTTKISLIPSANIEVAGRLTVDALVVESGLKVISTLHTATGSDLIVQIHHDSIDVKFALPVEKQNLVSATHDIVFHTREWGAPEVDEPLKFAQNKDFSICLDQLSPFIGLTFCGEFTGPNLQGQKVPILPFPLSGDGKIAITIEREDLSHYHYKEVAYTSNEKIGGEIILEALAKNGQKKVSLAFEAFLIPEKIIRASLTSPVISAALEGRIINTVNEKSLSIRLVQDQNEYLGKIGVEIHGSPEKSIYKPIIQYKTPQNSAIQVPPFRVEGQVIVEHEGSLDSTYTLDNVKLVIPDQKTINVSGKLGNEPETVFADVTVSDGVNSLTFKGKLRVNPNLIKYNAELKNSLSPQSNLHVKGDLERTGDQIKHFFQLAHGGDFSDKKNVLTIENAHRYRNKGPEDFLLETKNTLIYPVFDTTLKFNFELKPKAVEYELDIQYANVKLGSGLEWEHDSKRDGTDFKIEFNIWGLNNRFDLKSKRLVTGEQSQIENSLEINGKRLEVNGKIKHHIKPQDIDVAVDLIIKTPRHSTPFIVLSGLKANVNEIDASHKITSGNTVYVDLFLKANKAGNANGSIKVNLKDQLVITGQVKANRGTGSSEIVIELPEVQRTSKIDSTFTIREPSYNVVVNIYPIFNKDKAHKIILSTHTSISGDAIDSKNFIDVFGEKVETNFKGSQHGDIANGKITGEVDVTLPNQHYIAAKLNREITNVNKALNGHFLASLEHRAIKNQPGNKVTLKGQLKNTKPDENIYDVSYQLLGEKADGGNLNVDLKVKRQVQGETTFLEINNKIYGSELSNPIEALIKTSCKESVVGTYDITFSHSPLGTLLVQGKHDFSGAGKPITGDLTVDLSSPSKSLRTLKIGASGSIEKTKALLIKGQIDLFVDAPDGVLIEISTIGEIQTSDKESRLKGTFKPGKGNLFSIDSGFKTSESKEGKQLEGIVNLKYGSNQHIEGDFIFIQVTPHEYKLNAKLDTTLEEFKNNKLQIHAKRNEENTHLQNQLIFTSDGKTWTSESNIVLSEITPSIETKVTCPEGKVRHILVKVTKSSDSQLAGQLKIVNEKTNFLVEGTIDVNFQSVDDFHMKITANSPNLQIDKYLIEAHNKPAKTGRRIQVTAKSNNKNILAGSTSYTAREEQGKLIVEGSGSFKVYDQTKSANFKYIRQNLSQTKNGETGIEISFDAGLGNKAIDAELKVTNKQFRILNSYCEEKKQCAHVEIDVKTATDDPNLFNQEIEIAIDLRKLGLSHEFGFKAVTTRKEYILDHTVDIHIQSQENSKYQYSLYLHPKEAGISLTTPKRVVSLEANVNYPPNILKNGGRISGDVVLYTNKKHQPNQKSSLTAFLDLKSSSISGEIRFTNPVLRRPLVVEIQSKGTPNYFDIIIVADVFSTPDQKLIGSYIYKWSDLTNWKQATHEETFKIKGSPLLLDITLENWASYSVDNGHYKVGSKLNYVGRLSQYDSLVYYEITPKNLQLGINFFNIPVLKIESQLKILEDQQIVDSEIKYYGQNSFISHVEVKHLNTLKYTLARKDNLQDKLQINAGFKPGEIADFRAEIIKGGTPHELSHVTVKLDDTNFLKFDYNVDSKNVEEFLFRSIKKSIQDEGNALKELSDKVSKNIEDELNNLGELAKKALPTFTFSREYYANEVKKIKEEILADKTIRNASEFLYNILSAFSQAFEELFTHLSSLIENIVLNLQNTFGKVFETIQKDILPKIKEINDKTINLIVETINSASNIVLTIGTKAAEIAEKYRPELQQLAAVLGEISQDILKAAIDVYEALRNVVLDQWQQIYNEIKQLPAVEQLKAEFERFVKEGFLAPEALANGLRDLLSTFKDIAPTPELKELVEAIADYITKKLNQQPIDDKVAIDRIVKAAVANIKQLIGVLEGEVTAPELQGVKVPVPGNFWNRLPKVGSVHLSSISYVLREDVIVPYEFLLSLINKPRNWIPPFPLYGLIAQGQHIFTFDGKHLTFPGKCNYLLARDAVDGNFTIIGSYNNGLLTAISLTQGSATITLKKHGQILVNNAPAELPARKFNIAAYRDSERIVLRSIYGVRIVCGPELTVCSITASGFYHGKLRGLLGNGNNEAYDDFVLPNGKIVTSESEFGNSYKTTSTCAAVQTVSHHGHHATPSCDKLFGWDSNLRFCYSFIPTENFKLACEHGVAAGVKDTEHAVAIAYVAACNQHNIPIRVPSEFVKCTNGEKPTAVGEQFSVRTPGKAADFVVLVDTNKDNEATYKEYIQPLIQQLTTELNSKGVSDIEFHIIAYGGDNQWPSHITTAGGKLTFKGKAPNLKFGDKPKEESLVTGCPHLDGLLQFIKEIGADLDLALGLDLQALTYNEGLEYPFRANAVKTVIAVTGSPCKVGRFYPLQVLRTLLYRDKNIHLNLITPVSRVGAKAEAKNIVGFNARSVFAVGQTRNKLKYFSDLGKELNYYDYCIDFTVQNDGNVFISDHIHLQPKGTRKQFVQVTSHSIVEQLLGTEKGYDCECKFTSPYSATNICKVVSVKEKPQAKKSGTKT